MPIPFILGALAVAAGVGGVGAGIKGAIDMADANDTLSKAKKRDEENQQRHKNIDEQTCKSMDMLGGLEMNILASFKNFAYLIEKIKKFLKLYLSIFTIFTFIILAFWFLIILRIILINLLIRYF